MRIQKPLDIGVDRVMREIDSSSAADYLRERGWVQPEAKVSVKELSGGVSNIVLRVDVEGQPAFVLKQCREKLRVAMEWKAPLERIWTEKATLELLGEILPAGLVPTVLWEDQEDYLFAMTCASDDAVTWKERLMAGDADPALARRVGEILGTIHARAAGAPALRGRLADTSLFEELRIDPYYRTVANTHLDLRSEMELLIRSMNATLLIPTELTLVHGDFSPKNILVNDRDQLLLLDFECAHAGDPAFDLGFLLSHLMLKAFRAELGEESRAGRPHWPAQVGGRLVLFSLMEEFWEGYEQSCGHGRDSTRGRRGIMHMAACCLARVDGKSPVEYLDGKARGAVRGFARKCVGMQCQDWGEVLRRAEVGMQL